MEVGGYGEYSNYGGRRLWGSMLTMEKDIGE